MNKSIKVFDIVTKKIFEESIPAESLLKALYEGNSISLKVAKHLIVKIPIVSKAFGLWMKMPWTKKGIAPFVKKYGVKMEDFEQKKYKNFNDFFIRKLDPNARIISKERSICPCDGRHLFFQDLSEKNFFYVKGKNFSLDELLKDKELASKYFDGSMIISRLAPVDYHRFHFPVDGKIEEIKLINGFLYSVNPIALRTNPQLITENKRILTKISSDKCGDVLQVLVGATNVGSIHISAKLHKKHLKGDELGFFSFGGSMIITLFPKGKVEFSQELINKTKDNIEVLMQMGSNFLHYD
jgi:phosphatidylserine decarboxylase